MSERIKPRLFLVPEGDCVINSGTIGRGVRERGLQTVRERLGLTGGENGEISSWLETGIQPNQTMSIIVYEDGGFDELRLTNFAPLVRKSREMGISNGTIPSSMNGCYFQYERLTLIDKLKKLIGR